KKRQFDRETFERARREVQDEIERDSRDPFRTAYAALRARMYRESPYGETFAGSATALDRVDRERAQAYLNRCYTPDRTVVAVAGNIPELEVQRVLGNYLVDYRRLPARRSRDVPPDRLSESARTARSLPVSTTAV